MIRSFAIFCLLVGGIVDVAPSEAIADPLIREQQKVAVGGAEETWMLVWDKAPSSFCGARDISTSATCPCTGFAYGQTGKMWLVRRRDGRDIERMDLGPLFQVSDGDIYDYQPGNSYIQRWPLKFDDLAREDRDDPTLVPEIMSRPAPTLMNFANFDHDRGAQEFLIQVATEPCGKLQFSAVGVSENRPHLHFLSSVERPNEPLVMPLPAWQALVPGSAPHTLVVWGCWDHGSDAEIDLTVSATDGAIRVKSTEYSCLAHGTAQKP